MRDKLAGADVRRRRPPRRDRGGADAVRRCRCSRCATARGPWRSPPAQDYKRVGDGDTGPNTGGMGAWSPLPFVGRGLRRRRARRGSSSPTLAALRDRGIDYRGVLYAGLMLTAEGPKLIEYNVRFGDPDTQVVLPAAHIGPGRAAGRGRRRVAARRRADVRRRRAASRGLRHRGLPGAPRTGDVIDGLDDAGGARGRRRCSAPAWPRGDDGRLVTAGGRVLDVVRRGPPPSRRPAGARVRGASAASPGRACTTGPTSRRTVDGGGPASTMKVAVLMGSPNDMRQDAAGGRHARRFGIDADVRVMSAHRNAGRRRRRSRRSARERRATPRSSAAPAWPRTSPARCAAHTTLPVVGVPLSGGALNGVDALYATVQMPQGMPGGDRRHRRRGQRRAARRADAGHQRRRPGRASSPTTAVSGRPGPEGSVDLAAAARDAGGVDDAGRYRRR